jgi:flagellar biosynthesis/type III secretory pathway protein FliH
MARGKEMRTFSLPDGSVAKLVDVKAARVQKHFFGDKFYVTVEFRDGSTKEVIEHLSAEAAQAERTKIVSAIKDAWAEVDAYDFGYEEGHAQAKTEVWSQANQQGHEEGYRVGFQNGEAAGYREGRRSILSPLIERREALIAEQLNGGHKAPSQRRYLQISISLLTDIIRYFSPQPPQIPAD